MILWNPTTEPSPPPKKKNTHTFTAYNHWSPPPWLTLDTFQVRPITRPISWGIGISWRLIPSGSPWQGALKPCWVGFSSMIFRLTQIMLRVAKEINKQTKKHHCLLVGFCFFSFSPPTGLVSSHSMLKSTTWRSKGETSRELAWSSWKFLADDLERWIKLDAHWISLAICDWSIQRISLEKD